MEKTITSAEIEAILQSDKEEGVVSGYSLVDGLTISVSFEVQRIQFKNCEFLKGISLLLRSNLPVTFTDCQIRGGIHFASDHEPGALTIESSKAEEIKLNSDKDKLFVTHNSEVDLIGSNGEIYIDNSNVGTINSEGSLNSEGKCSFSFVFIFGGSFNIDRGKTTIGIFTILDAIEGRIFLGIIDHLIFQDQFNAALSLQGCKIKKLNLVNYSNDNYMVLDSIGLEQFKITDSNFDKVRILNSDLTQTEFITYSSILTGLEFESVVWPTTPFISAGNLPKGDWWSLAARDAYRHLKIAATNQQDSVHRVLFRSLEMDSYYNSLSWRGGVQNFFDKLNLWFSKKTNNYGLNWWRPILIYLGISLTYYFLFFLVDIEFQFSELKYLLGYPDFGIVLNPTRDTENYHLLAQGNAFRVIADFSLRIIQGILIYQVIVPFRKFFN